MPKTLARSVIASAGMPSAAARSTASSMRTMPSVKETPLWSRRWTKAGFGMAGNPRAGKFYHPRLARGSRRAGRREPGALGPAGGREAQRERGLEARLASHADPAAVQLGDRLDDREPE